MDIVGISLVEQVKAYCTSNTDFIREPFFTSNISTGMSLVKIFFSFCSYQEAVFRTLAAILHLGNIEFSPGEDHDSSVIKDEKSNFHLQMAAELLMLVIPSCLKFINQVA